MRRPRLVWRLFFSFLVITFVCLGAFAWYASHLVHELSREQLRQNLQAEARLVKSRLAEPAAERDAAEVDRLCRELGGALEGRVSVILPSGEMLGDSLRAPEMMGNWSSYPEVMTAVGGGIGTAERKSPITGRRRMYLALPLDGGQVGVLRLGVSAGALHAQGGRILSNFATVGACLAVFAAILCYVVSRRIVKPLEKIKRGAARFARGNLQYRISVPGSPELGELAETLNQMAEQLSDSMSDETQQRGKLRAILDSMEEGVVAVGRSGRILDINPAAARLLGLSVEQVRDRMVQEITRSAHLQRFVERALRERNSEETEVELERGENVRLRARMTPLSDASGNYLGGLLILQDMTRVRRLERVRKDFVANVTHELKTPITSIQGFVETLLDGAYKDPESAERFLHIVDRQVGRLNSIIEDLLVLSRMEEQRDVSGLDVESVAVKEVIQSAIDVCARRAEERDVRIRQKVPGAINACVNAPLVEQAVVNLVENAIKYSDEGGVVDVSAESRDGDVCIAVSDRGCGIPDEHQNRIFERFYRVDKGRSREMGGTGLGLSIVRHVVDLHGGQIRVDSAPGRGSTFTICFPA